MYNESDLYGIAGKYVSDYGRYLRDEDQEDMKQEIVLAMWQGQGRADNGQNPDAFTCKTGKGIALNTFRKMHRNNTRFLTTLNADLPGEDEDSDLDGSDLLTAPESGYVADILKTEMASAIESAIATLPTVQASAVKRILQDGATLESFGSEQGFTKERARQILEMAKATLASNLREWAPEVYA